MIYRKGVAPAPEVNSSSSEEESSDEEEKKKKQQQQKRIPAATVRGVEAVAITKVEISAQEKRLQRLSQQQGRSNLKEKNIAKEQEANEGGEEEEEDEDDEDGRRARIRQKALQNRTRNNIAERKVVPEEDARGPIHVEKRPGQVVKEQSKEEEEEEEESEEESSSEEEEQALPQKLMFKPFFVPKGSRETSSHQKQLEEDALKLEKMQEEKAGERKLDSSNLVMEVLKKDIVEAQAALEYIELDDTDDVDLEEETAAWKIRELLRIKRDREQREYRLVDHEDVERRRLMSDSQIEMENITDGKLGAEKDKQGFMQKYFHKGAFYSGDAEVEEALKKVNASAPTLGDHSDKSVLPDILKVKNFGKSGRTKYTHLVDQDTTGLDAAWTKVENTSQRIQSQMGGMKSGFSNPTKKRKTT